MNKIKQYRWLIATVAIALSFGMWASAEYDFLGRIADQIAEKIYREDIKPNIPNFAEEAPVFGAFPGGDMHGPIMIRDRFTQAPNINATSTTGTAATILQRDLLRNQYDVVTLGGAQDTDFTYTLPASTSMNSLLPYVGSRTRNCWFNRASSTSIHTLIFAAGTGIDIRHASTTDDGLSAPVAIGAEEGFEICFEFIRQPRDQGSLSLTGDVTAVLEIYADTD